ncbi:MAG: hypothetical protein WC568_08850 [Candidatus Methanoperedens sp.]
MPNSMTEDALYKALLKNKPQQEPQKPPAAQTAPKTETIRTIPAPQPAESYEKEEITATPPVKPVQADLVVESIKNLNSSVNLMYGLIKTVIVPVLVLILIVSIAILVKSK